MRQWRKLLFVAIGLPAVAVAGNWAIAADPVPLPAPPTSLNTPIPIYAPEVDYGYHSSTAAEGYARGLADVVRSQGAYNLLSSQAAVNLTEARRREIENAEKWTQTYFEMRRLNRAYREVERGPRPSSTDWIRYSQTLRPERLTPSDLDLVTGQIRWPILLQADPFKESRDVIQQLFAARASRGLLSTEGYLTIDKVTGAMLATLQESIKEVPSQDYMTARKFLESLAYEAKVPSG